MKYLWALAGNSRTLAIAYAVELLGILEMAKVLDWSSLLGAERGGRVAAVIGIMMIFLRLITMKPVNFKPEA